MARQKSAVEQYVDAGMAYVDSNPQAAIQAFNQAIAIQPTDPDNIAYAHYGLACTYANAGQHDYAVHCSLQALQLVQPDDLSGQYFMWCGLGQSYFNTGRYVECVHACQQALAAQPDDSLNIAEMMLHAQSIQSGAAPTGEPKQLGKVGRWAVGVGLRFTGTLTLCLLSAVWSAIIGTILYLADVLGRDPGIILALAFYGACLAFISSLFHRAIAWLTNQHWIIALPVGLFIAFPTLILVLPANWIGEKLGWLVRIDQAGPAVFQPADAAPHTAAVAESAPATAAPGSGPFMKTCRDCKWVSPGALGTNCKKLNQSLSSIDQGACQYFEAANRGFFDSGKRCRDCVYFEEGFMGGARCVENAQSFAGPDTPACSKYNDRRTAPSGGFAVWGGTCKDCAYLKQGIVGWSCSVGEMTEGPTRSACSKFRKKN